MDDLTTEEGLMLEDLRKQLISHDWWSHMSDDFRTYKRGQMQSDNIARTMARCREHSDKLGKLAEEMYNDLKPDNF